MMRLQYGAVEVTVSRPELPLVVAVVRGVVTPGAVQSIIAGAASWGSARLAQVVRYDDAQVGMSAADLFAAAMKVQRGDIPTALVVAPDQLRVFREYAQMNADRGVMKAAFTRMEAAQRWAVGQLRVQAHWRRLERALGSLP